MKKRRFSSIKLNRRMSWTDWELRLISLLAFFERLKNNDDNKEKQPSIEQDSSESNKSKNEVIEETRPKRSKGVRR